MKKLFVLLLVTFLLPLTSCTPDEITKNPTFNTSQVDPETVKPPTHG